MSNIFIFKLNKNVVLDIICVDDKTFLYFHRKTTPIRDDNTQLVYQLQPDYRRNYRISILKPYSKIDKLIADLLVRKKAFYQDNRKANLFSLNII